MVTLGQKLGHGVKFKENIVNTLEIILLTRFSSNSVRIFASIKSRSGLNMGRMRSKTSSQGQIQGKPCEHSRGDSFDMMHIQLDQNV